MNSWVLFRLTVCLVLMHGCGHVASVETDGGFKGGDPREYPSVSEMAGQDLAMEAVEEVVEGDDSTVGDEGNDPWMSVKGDGKPTELSEEGTVEVVDEASGEFGKTGECVGRRFKKCR